MQILLLIALLLISLGFLVKASSLVVKYSVEIAKILNVSELVIGLTIIAIGTSLPETISAVFSALHDNGDLIVGNVIGANMSNLTIVLGVAVLFSPITINKNLIKRDLTIMIFSSTFTFIVVAIGFFVSWFDAISSLLLFVAYVSFLFFSIKEKKQDNFLDFVHYFITAKYLHHLLEKGILTLKTQKAKNIQTRYLLKKILLLGVSLTVVFISAKYLVDFALDLAFLLGVNASLIGVLLAIGTTMPELSVTVSAARQGKGNLLLGNIFGSCTTNSLFVVGTAAMAKQFFVSPAVVMDIAITLLIIIFLSLFIFFKRKLSRVYALALFLAYGLFLSQFLGA
ncbi:MAG: calcium/sodium antiporter [Candidatus Diapherotrites archaeon]